MCGTRRLAVLRPVVVAHLTVAHLMVVRLVPLLVAGLQWDEAVNNLTPEGSRAWIHGRPLDLSRCSTERRLFFLLLAWRWSHRRDLSLFW